MNANQRVPSLVQRTFETDDDELEFIGRLLSYIVSDFRDVRVVQRGVHLVKNEEWSGLEAARTIRESEIDFNSEDHTYE